MFRKTKYIVAVVDGKELPFVFPNLINHNDMARGLPGLAKSAGFCHITDDGMWEAYGRSESLRLDSRPSQDSDLLNCYLIGGH